MFLVIIAVFALGVATGTVADNQLDGKIGNVITGGSVSDTAKDAKK